MTSKLPISCFSHRLGHLKTTNFIHIPAMQPPPPPRVKSKMDSLIFMPDSITTANVEEHVSMERKSSSVPRPHNGKKDRETTENEVEDVVEVENVERPVDLFKVLPLSLHIFQLLQLLIFLCRIYICWVAYQ